VGQEQKKPPTYFTLLIVLLAKSTKLLKLAKAAKLLKFTKAIATFLTMTLSMFVYSFMLGPWFAFGFVVMLFIHEMGHVIALNRKGYMASAPIFIPMLGAVIFAPKLKNADEEAYIGFGGPFIGGLAALVLFGFYLVMPEPSEIVLLVSYTAAFLNLFNMLPIRPLDGGRITQIVGGWFKWFGIAGLLWLSWVLKTPVVLLIWILVLGDIKLHLWFRFGTGMTAWAAMTVLMILGYSDQPFWADILDVILAGWFNLIFFVQAYNDEREEAEPSAAPLPLRLQWLGLYLALAAGLYALMAWQIPYLPVLKK
jgi:Zn-dependent protease